LLKEWGTPVDDADDSIFLTENLEEFQSTNLEYLLSFAGRHGAQLPQVDLSPRPSNLPLVDDRKILPRKDQERPTKRRRLDNGFLHDIIPNVRAHIFQINLLDLLTIVKNKQAPLPSFTIRQSHTVRYLTSNWLRKISP